MKIELLKIWGLGNVGDILPDVNKPVAELLIKRGIAKRFKKKKAKK
jgi:hypothetical protein